MRKILIGLTLIAPLFSQCRRNQSARGFMADYHHI